MVFYFYFNVKQKKEIKNIFNICFTTLVVWCDMILIDNIIKCQKYKLNQYHTHTHITNCQTWIILGDFHLPLDQTNIGPSYAFYQQRM